MTKHCHILIVDDTPQNIKVLNDLLKSKYKISAAKNGPKALDIIFSENKPDLILLDIMMPGMDGYEVCRQVRSVKETENIPIIFVTAMSEVQDETKGLALGAVDYITKPINPSIVLARVNNHLELKQYRDDLEEEVRKRTRELTITQRVIIESMATLAEYRDPETGGHIQRTQNYVLVLADYLLENTKYAEFLDKEIIHLLFISAPLHDIGKIGIPDNILFKPGKLTADEFTVMKQHVTFGHDAIAASEKRLGKQSFLTYAKEIAYTHHEKWDGSGYPRNLTGEEIPLSGRIMAIADVYDALVSKRIYKPPFSHAEAINIITMGRGKHFDPILVDAFLEIEEEFRQIAIKYADTEEERKALSVRDE